MMKSKGRPGTRSVQLKNGFYIEVCNRGNKKGIKIWSGTSKGMEDTAKQYSDYKDVIVLGEFKDGIPFIDVAAA